MIKAEVTKDDMLSGVCGDPLRCAVALALDRATGDNECMVCERDWMLHLVVWGRYIEAPYQVRDFIRNYDDQPRTEDNRLDAGHDDYVAPEPFSFELPDMSDPEWKEECYHCEELVEQNEVDDEGVCETCRADGTEEEGETS